MARCVPCLTLPWSSLVQASRPEAVWVHCRPSAVGSPPDSDLVDDLGEFMDQATQERILAGAGWGWQGGCGVKKKGQEKVRWMEPPKRGAFEKPHEKAHGPSSTSGFSMSFSSRQALPWMTQHCTLDDCPNAPRAPGSRAMIPIQTERRRAKNVSAFRKVLEHKHPCDVCHAAGTVRCIARCFGRSLSFNP